MPIDDLPPNTQQATIQKIYGYQSYIESLLFAAIITWPDIVRVASKLSEHLKNLSNNHLVVADQYISYLYGIKYLAIEYLAHNNSQETTTMSFSMEIFDNLTDASFVNNPNK